MNFLILTRLTGCFPGLIWCLEITFGVGFGFDRFLIVKRFGWLAISFLCQILVTCTLFIFETSFGFDLVRFLTDGLELAFRIQTD